MSPTAVHDAAESAGIQADVLAAGAVCWRERDGELEVLLIHRPRYKDWSWPKGKVEKGETLPECAVREVEEETGYTVTLGRPLPEARYRIGRRLQKHVAYWAAEVTSTKKPAPHNLREIDKGRWVSPAEAYRMLTRYDDREQLEVVERAWDNGRLRVWPLIIVRHGKAYPRARWHETEHKRPLLALGSRQSMALTGLLAAWAPSRLISSPWKRCIATLTPYSAATSKPIRQKKEISEKASKLSPVKAHGLIAKLISRGRSVAVCTHRPVLPVLFQALADAAPKSLANELPSKDPYLSPGEILVAYIQPGEMSRIIAFERFRPIDS
ncbi:NUDIX hydrolase [Saxibacter everestensis]|uniref:NUDIX hydrolase n=1 Tax=Saxibacter everestensis TaxID=2909229 RepID=A0ABY8QU08_9MICO|nr:NUDIX hydrolase [Brevibacteriaceae bacterium ZFBP1038]